MRKIIAIEFLSLDGVYQGPGSVDEDPRNGFHSGGWVGPFADPLSSEKIRSQMALDFDLLLGRTTYEQWSEYWPNHRDQWPQADRATKFVVSRQPFSGSWGPFCGLVGEAQQTVSELRMTAGPNLHVFGSGQLVQSLLAANLVDELWLRIHPVLLGGGWRLFSSLDNPLHWRLAETILAPSGVILATYQRPSGAKA